jgi:hypothetical protein
LGCASGFANDSLELVTVGRWSFPAGCFHLASPWLASSCRRSTLAPPCCLSYEDTLAFTRPLFRRGEPRWLPGSSLGILKDRPSVVLTVCVHSRRTGARGYHLSSAFRPCRSSRLRRFAPHNGIAGLLHPAADHGVRLVSSRPPTVADARPSSQALHPSERFPLQQRLSPSPKIAPRHWGPYPLVVRGCFPKNAIARRPQGFLHWRVRCVCLVLPPRSHPLLPWAFPSRTPAFAEPPDCSCDLRRRSDAAPDTEVPCRRDSLPTSPLAGAAVTVGTMRDFRRA